MNYLHWVLDFEAITVAVFLWCGIGDVVVVWLGAET